MSSVALKSGLALLFVAGLTTGCAVAEKDDAGSAPAKSPRETLTAAAPGTSTAPYSFAITGLDSEGDPQDIKGVSSPTAKSWEMTVTYADAEDGTTTTMQLRAVDRAAWMKMSFEGIEGLPETPDKWVLMDPSKATAEDAIAKGWTESEADPTGAADLIATIVDATETGPGAYSGTLDLTKAPAADIVDLEKAGDAVKAVPFTATVDGSGRLTALTLKVPAVGTIAAFAYQVTYAYDGVAAVEAPVAAEVTDAPASLDALTS